MRAAILTKIAALGRGLTVAERLCQLAEVAAGMKSCFDVARLGLSRGQRCRFIRLRSARRCRSGRRGGADKNLSKAHAFRLRILLLVRFKVAFGLAGGKLNPLATSWRITSWVIMPLRMLALKSSNETPCSLAAFPGPPWSPGCYCLRISFRRFTSSVSPVMPSSCLGDPELLVDQVAQQILVRSEISCIDPPFWRASHPARSSPGRNLSA